MTASETQIEQAMRLAEARLQVHKQRTQQQAELLKLQDEPCWKVAELLRRDADEDQLSINELHELRRKMKADS